MSASHPSPCCAHIRVTYKPIEHANGGLSDRWTCDDCSTEFRPLAARSHAPTLKHPDSFLVRIERPGGVRFMEATAPTLDEAAEGVGLQRRAAPSVEARETVLGYPLRVDASIPADEIRFVQNGQTVGVIRLAASLLPPEKT